MEDTTTVADQPTQGAQQTGGEQATGHESFLGIEPNLDDLAEGESPASSAEAESEGGEAEAGTEGEAQSQAGEQTEEPSIAEWLGTFTPEERAAYAKRYPTAWKALNDPNQPEDLKQLFRDKINTDFEYERLRKGSEAGEETVEQEGDEDEPGEQTTQATDPVESRKQYYAEVQRLVENHVDPEAIQQLGMDLLSGFGVDVSSKDPEVQALIQNAPKVGATLARGAVDLVNTLLPHILRQHIETTHPGFGEMYERSLYALQWDKVRSQAGPDNKALYPNLPAYGTEQFGTVLRKAAATIPGFDEMVFRGRDGRILPPQQQAERKYSILAKIASGQQVNPAVVRDAVETGKKLAGRTQAARTAGKALGAGQSNQQFAAKGGGDPMLDELDVEIARQNSSLRPVTGAK